MQIGHRWTSMHLIGKHMHRTFKNNNSYISLLLCVLIPFLLPLHSLTHSELRASATLAPCHRHLWNYSNEDTMFLLFTALNGDTETRLEHSWTPFLTLTLQLPPPSRSLSLSLCERCCRRIGGTSPALWEAINECVAWRVAMRSILQPFIRAGRHLTGGQPTGCVII